MSRRGQWYLVGGVLVFGALVMVAASRVGAPEAVAVGSRAPEFRAVTLDGASETRQLSDYRGHVVLLNVWATWCLPCRDEMPSIERLHRELGPRGLKVVAVSVDEPGAGVRIREFVQEYGLTFDILHDAAARIAQTYQMVGVPETFVIDARGVIRKKAFAADWYSEENRALVAELLSEL